MSRIVKDLRARIFSSTARDRDAYHAEIETHLVPGVTVLDVGCGKGRLSPFPWNRPPEVRVVGIDPDPEAKVNELIHEFHHMQPGEPWPVAGGSIDVAVCRYVVEHVEDPDQLLGDVRRVLQPGGRFIFLTPSRYQPGDAALVDAAPWSPPGDPGSHREERRRRRIRDVLSHELEARPACLRAEPRRLSGAPAPTRRPRVGLFRLQPPVLFGPHLAAYYMGRLVRLDRQLGASLLGVFAKS